MALKIRRGTDTVRQTITPSEGELVYTTDTKKIFVGDGSTLGGTQVSGVNEGVANAIAYYEQNGKEVSTTHNLKWNDISNILFVDKGQLVISNENSSRTVATISQNYSSAGGSNFVFARSRGSAAQPTSGVINDVLGNINFNSYSDGAVSYITSAAVTAYLPLVPTASGAPFAVNFVSKTGTGPYYVTYSFVTQPTAPVVSRAYTIDGNSAEGYNGTYRVSASTTSSMTLFYPSNPGTYGSGTTTAYMEAINPGTLSLLTQSSNGNLFRTLKVTPDGLVVIGALPLDYTPVGLPQSRPFDSGFSGQLAINSNSTNAGQTSALAQLTLRTYADTTYGQSINLYRFRGTQIGASAVQNGDQIFIFKFAGSDGPTGAGIAATINTTVDGAVSTGKVPGAITFATANVTSGSLVNTLKLDSNQQATFYGNVKHSALEIINPNYITVSSSAPYTLSSTQTTNILLMTANTYTITLNMPASPVDGQVCIISVSGYSVNLQTGTGTVLPSFAGSSKQPGTVFKYVYRTSNTTWYQIG
jgi:hypothetical protein